MSPELHIHIGLHLVSFEHFHFVDLATLLAVQVIEDFEFVDGQGQVLYHHGHSGRVRH